MIDWILHNKEWLFSGLGLAILVGLGKLLYSSLHRRALSPVSGGAAPRVTSAVPTTVLHKNTTAALEDWLNTTVRIRIGDYHSVQTGPWTIRVEVTDIRIAPIPEKYGLGVKDELAVELYVDLGGAVVCGGASTVAISVNKYLVPRVDNNEGLRSIYFISTSDHTTSQYCAFIRICVTHINSHDGCADVNIASVSGKLSAA